MKQIAHCYSANKHNPTKFHLHATCFTPKFIDSFLISYPHYDKWDMKFHLEDYIEIFKDRLQNLVYLTADEPNVILNELEEGKVYIIGGLVDKNRYKVKKKNFIKRYLYLYKIFSLVIIRY